MAVNFYSDIQLDSKLTVGVDDTGHDVKFFGATSGQYMLWDESNNALLLNDNTYIGLGSASTGDLQLVHNGTNSGITNLTGDLYIANYANDKDIILQSDDGSGGYTAYITLDGSTKTIETSVPINVGVDNTGYDVKFFGATSGQYMLWDESADTLFVTGEIDAGSLDISGNVDVDGTLETDAFSIGGTTVSSTAAELNLLDGSSANSVVNSKAVIYGSSGELAGTLSTAAQANITSLGALTALTVDDIQINGAVIGHAEDTDLITLSDQVVTVAGELDAVSLDISGDADIDGTLETDALSIGGTTVSATAAELNVLDGVTAGTVTASLGVVVDSSKALDEITLTKRKIAVSSTTDGNVGSGDIVYFGTGSSVVGKIYHYKSDGSWELADANAAANCDGLLAVAIGTDPDVDGMLLRGMVTLVDIQGTEAVGDVLYLSESATGAADCVAPAGNGDIIRVIGYCLSTDDQIWFNPDNTFVEVTA